jgi:hypothetical protein
VAEIEIGAFLRQGKGPEYQVATPDRNIAGRDGQYPCRSVPLRCYAGTQETARQVKSESRHPLGSAMRLQLAPTERLVVDGNGRQLFGRTGQGAGMDELSANLPGWSCCQRFRFALQSAAGKDPATHRVSHRRNCKAHQ